MHNQVVFKAYTKTINLAAVMMFDIRNFPINGQINSHSQILIYWFCLINILLLWLLDSVNKKLFWRRSLCIKLFCYE